MVRQLVGIDHVVVGVRDLDQARTDYQRLGFQPTPRGRHVGWGTGNHCLMFPNDHVVLLGVVEPGQVSGDLEPMLAEREGLFSLALRSTDAAATQAAWLEAGLEPAAVMEHTCRLDSGEELGFQNVMLAPEATGGVPVFGCAHLRPDALREPPWTDHPNGAIGIQSVTVAVDDPAAMVGPMAMVFGETTLTETDDTLAVHTGSSVLMFATPDDLDMLHPELEPVETDRRPLIAALSLRVRHLDATAAWLEAHDIAHRRDVGGAIGVSRAATHGVMLEFVGT